MLVIHDVPGITMVGSKMAEAELKDENHFDRQDVGMNTFRPVRLPLLPASP
jgi:hypothetical protein